MCLDEKKMQQNDIYEENELQRLQEIANITELADDEEDDVVKMKHDESCRVEDR
jgi:hypothetical protein